MLQNDERFVAVANDANGCKHCGKKPRVIQVPGNLYYAQCTCGKWNIYEFIGVSPQGCIENWNMYNPKKPQKYKRAEGVRTFYKKKTEQ